MLTRPSSIQLSELTKHTELHDVEDDVSSSVSTIQFRLNSRKVVLPNHFTPADIYSSLRCINDDDFYNDVMSNGILILTEFLRDVGPGRSSSINGCTAMNGRSPLCHRLSIVLDGEDNVGTLGITEIQKEARTLLPIFERITDDIVKYSTHNGPTSTDLECDDINYSCGVKDYASIRNKAKRKYDGDILQVKDVLRGQITFPDEGSLICGLSSLYNAAERGGNVKQIESVKSSRNFQIVRLKNLFRTTSVGNELCNALPTGYRHILINIKFECGLIAGKSDPRVENVLNALKLAHFNLSYRIAISTCTAFSGYGRRRLSVAPRNCIVCNEE
jgi:hypothetical protein